MEKDQERTSKNKEKKKNKKKDSKAKSPINENTEIINDQDKEKIIRENFEKLFNQLDSNEYSFFSLLLQTPLNQIDFNFLFNETKFDEISLKLKLKTIGLLNEDERSINLKELERIRTIIKQLQTLFNYNQNEPFEINSEEILKLIQMHNVLPLIFYALFHNKNPGKFIIDYSIYFDPQFRGSKLGALLNDMIFDFLSKNPDENKKKVSEQLKLHASPDYEIRQKKTQNKDHRSKKVSIKTPDSNKSLNEIWVKLDEQKYLIKIQNDSLIEVKNEVKSAISSIITSNQFKQEILNLKEENSKLKMELDTQKHEFLVKLNTEIENKRKFEESIQQEKTLELLLKLNSKETYFFIEYLEDLKLKYQNENMPKNEELEKLITYINQVLIEIGLEKIYKVNDIFNLDPSIRKKYEYFIDFGNIKSDIKKVKIISSGWKYRNHVISKVRVKEIL